MIGDATQHIGRGRLVEQQRPREVDGRLLLGADVRKHGERDHGGLDGEVERGRERVVIVAKRRPLVEQWEAETDDETFAVARKLEVAERIEVAHDVRRDGLEEENAGDAGRDHDHVFAHAGRRLGEGHHFETDGAQRLA
eukprot:673474-Prymnesium_polylepis.1